MARTFGGTPADTIHDQSTGLPAPGAQLTIWTAPTGSQITALQDLDGTTLPGYVTAGPGGQIGFRIDSDSWALVWGRDNMGRWWKFVAEEVLVAAGDFPEVKAVAEAAKASADATSSALGEITRSIGTYASEAQLTGAATFVPALQAAIDTGANRITAPPGSTLLLDGTAYVDVSARKDLRLDFAGTTIVKTAAGGYATMLLDRFNGTSYGAGVQNLILENAWFRGSFADGAVAPIQPLGSNHGQRILIRSCVFEACQVQGYHTFELDGCDGVVFENCRWYGYRNDGVNAARTEAVNVDVSQVGAGATVAPYGSGLPCRNIRLVNCQFLPWTDPSSGTRWPAPIPLGTHGSREGAVTENVYLDIYVEDPPKDTVGGTFTLDDDNPYHRGLVHLPSFRHVRGRIRVRCTDGAGSIRVVQLQGATTGVVAASNPNGAATSGNFATPNPCEDVDLDIRVEGMKGPASPDNPIAYVTGSSARPARDIRIRISTDTAGANSGTYLRRVDTGLIDGDMPSTPNSARLVNSPNVEFGPSMRRTARATADRTVNNSTTLVNAAGLVVPVDRDAIYRVTGMIIYNSGTAPDLKLGWAAPAGATLAWTSDGISTGATTIVSSVYRGAHDLAATGLAGGNSGNDMVAMPEGLLTTGNTAGNLQLRFAQETATVADSTIRAGSWIRVERIG